MKLMTLYHNNTNYNKSKTNNIKQPVKFKGYTRTADSEHAHYNGIKHNGYMIPKNATPNYPGAYPNQNTKIYKADPFEIIPEEIYKTHDYTIRDDLYLSQIQKVYKNGYNNFANNANDEKKFLSYKIEEHTPILEESKRRFEGYNERVEFANDYTTREKLNKKLSHHKADYDSAVIQQNNLTEALKNASERYDLLKELDDAAGKKIKLNEEKEKLFYYKHLILKEKENVPKYIEKDLKWAKFCRNSYQKQLQKSDKKINEALNKNEPMEHIEKLMAEELKNKQKAKENYLYDKKRALESIKCWRKSIITRPERLLKLEEDLKRVEESLYYAGIDLDKIMAKVENFYRTKYKNWL